MSPDGLRVTFLWSDGFRVKQGSQSPQLIAP